MSRIYVSAHVDIDDLDLCPEDCADILEMFSDQAEKVMAYMKPESASYAKWHRAFNAVRRPVKGDILGLEWTDVEAMLERGDLHEIRRWLMPEVASRMPRPRLIKEPTP